MFSAYFELKQKSLDAVLNSMEFFCTNDCFKRFKSTHEFVTNYDVDEFIFPRHLDLNKLEQIELKRIKCHDNINTSQIIPQKYNSYEYFSRLFEDYSNKGETKIAALKFKNSFVLNELDESFFEHLFSSNNRWVNLDYRNNKNVRLRVDKNDELLISSMFNTHYLIECLNKTISSCKRFESRWNSPFSVVLAKGREKSVFNTSCTEFINQHQPDLTSDDSEIVDVHLDRGFSSHFRDDIEMWFLGQTLPFSNFRIDLEYYFFLLNLTIK